MVLKSNKYSLKFCKLYEEDVYGRYAIRPLKTHKNLNNLYFDVLKYSKKLKFLYRRYLAMLYFINKKVYSLKKILYLFSNIKNLKYSKSKILIKTNFYVNKILSLIKGVSHAIKKSQQILFSHSGKFNYRVDIGKPNRQRRRVTRYRIKLLTRHKIAGFSAQIPVYQFRKYIKINRNYKFFSTNFLFLLESRVDTMLYRLNFSASPGYIRQYILHNGVLVNNTLVKIPSYNLKINDCLGFVNNLEIFKKIFNNFIKKIVFMGVPNYYEVNYRIMLIKFFFNPRENMVFYPFFIDKLKLSSLGKNF